MCTFNNTFSHFLISKDVFHEMKGFDERFLGFGYEDTDFRFQYYLKYKEGIPNFMLHGIKNLDVKTFDSGVKNDNGSKYSKFNNDFLIWGKNPKYTKCDDGGRAIDVFAFPVKKNLDEEPQYVYEKFFKDNKAGLYG